MVAFNKVIVALAAVAISSMNGAMAGDEVADGLVADAALTKSCVEEINKYRKSAGFAVVEADPAVNLVITAAAVGTELCVADPTPATTSIDQFRVHHKAGAAEITSCVDAAKAFFDSGIAAVKAANPVAYSTGLNVPEYYTRMANINFANMLFGSLNISTKVTVACSKEGGCGDKKDVICEMKPANKPAIVEGKTVWSDEEHKKIVGISSSASAATPAAALLGAATVATLYMYL